MKKTLTKIREIKDTKGIFKSESVIKYLELLKERTTKEYLNEANRSVKERAEAALKAEEYFNTAIDAVKKSGNLTTDTYKNTIVEPTPQAPQVDGWHYAAGEKPERAAGNEFSIVVLNEHNTKCYFSFVSKEWYDENGDNIIVNLWHKLINPCDFLAAKKEYEARIKKDFEKIIDNSEELIKRGMGLYE